mgnify:CR=1 FL=1
MVWKIEYHNKVEKDLRKLDRKAQAEVLNFFDEKIAPTDNPFLLGKPLKGRFQGCIRYCIGQYRAICQIEDNQLIVLVLRVGHRRNIYDKDL